jgi:predicted transposase
LAGGSKEGIPERATIVGRLVVQDDLSASKLLLLMRRFRDAVEMAHNLLFKRGLSEVEVKRRLTKYLSNAWYASSAIKVAKLHREQRSVKLRKPLLYSVGSTDEGGNRNFKLVSTDKVLIKIPREVGGHEWVELKSLFGKRQLPIVEELVKGCHTYGAGVSIELRKGEDWRSAWRKRLILYVNVPIELYVKYRRSNVLNNVESVNKAHLMAGLDFNIDRVCMVIIDSAGKLRDFKSRFFSNAVNAPGEASKTWRGEAIAELVKYAVAHGVKCLAVEDLARPRSVEGKVGRWALMRYVQQLHVLARRFGVGLVEVEPAYTSVDAVGMARALGLDEHVASAYLIALRGLHKASASK